ncbi:MAG: ABC transporter ATP-binding protein [Planctomycetes bacterium]|nr:ABC transporter ATP-binding protein [Planctomycetota bacterium]
MLCPALFLRGVTYSFGPVQALTAVDLCVNEATVYGLIGLNGAGKTTTIRVVLGLLRPHGGEVRVLGADAVPREPRVFRRVGVLFEDFAAPSYLTGREHLVLQGLLLGMTRREAALAAERWLGAVGLPAKADARVRGYSLGMRRRLGLASALVGSPRLVILDEPTNGLDPQGIGDLRGLILELHRREGVTFLLSSHILGEVEQLCGAVGILHRGRTVLEGPVEELTRRAGSRLVRVAPVERALSVLGAAPWCEGVERAGVDGALRVRLGAEAVPRMVRELVEAGVDVHEISGSAETLESVFRRAVEAAEEAEADQHGKPKGGSPEGGAARAARSSS